MALARALCAVELGAGVVLLDEPTAQLDVRGEAEIFASVLAATRDVTIIVTSPTPESARLKAWLDGLGQGHRWITTEISLPWNSDAAVNRVLVPMDIVHLIVSTVEAAQ